MKLKPNEVGHFAYRPTTNSYDKGGYPRFYLSHDENEQGTISRFGTKWVNNWHILGEVDLVDIPKNHPYKECIIDLQTATDCYCADTIETEIDGVVVTKYIVLRGSGWSDCGFPFYDDTITNDDPYLTGKGCYALIRGLAMKRFLELAKQDCIPNLRDVTKGEFKDFKNDFALPAE